MTDERSRNERDRMEKNSPSSGGASRARPPRREPEVGGPPEGRTVQPTSPSPPVSAEAPLSRRRFLTYLLALTGAVGVGGLAAPIARFAYPVEETQVSPRQQVANLSQVEAGGEAVEFDYLERPGALIVLPDGTPRAFSRVCTHFGCIVDWRPEEEIFYCPCHAAEFAADGSVVAGPPPAPLVEFNVVQEGDALFVEGTV